MANKGKIALLVLMNVLVLLLIWGLASNLANHEGQKQEQTDYSNIQPRVEISVIDLDSGKETTVTRNTCEFQKCENVCNVCCPCVKKETIIKKIYKTIIMSPHSY